MEALDCLITLYPDSRQGTSSILLCCNDHMEQGASRTVVLAMMRAVEAGLLADISVVVPLHLGGAIPGEFPHALSVPPDSRASKCLCPRVTVKERSSSVCIEGEKTLVDVPIMSFLLLLSCKS